MGDTFIGKIRANNELPSASVLQEKYLSSYHFAEKHSVRIKCPPEHVWPIVDQLDFSDSWIIRVLFALRGLSPGMMNVAGLQRNLFLRLEQKEGKEIIIGLIGRFWRPSGNLQQFEQQSFIPFNSPGFAKATLSFSLTPGSNGTTLLETETRIFCTDEVSHKKFLRYWFFIRPFSGIIRKEILKSVKRKSET